MSIKAKQASGEILAIAAPGRAAPSVPYDGLGVRIGDVADPINPQDVVTLAWISANIPAAGIVANRRDHSVNGAIIEDYRALRPVMKTQTNVNPAGGYSGTGIGNKAILGHFLPGPPFPAGGTMLLSALASVEYTIDRISPEVSGANVIAPYVNLMVVLNPAAPPASQIFVIMVLGDWGNLVPTGVFTPAFPPNPPVSGPGPNLINMVWTPATSLVLVVNFEGMASNPGYPAVPPPAPPPFNAGVWTNIVTPTFPGPAAPVTPPAPGSWTSVGYKIGGGGPTDILTAYPGAVILNINPLIPPFQTDNGLPKDTIVSGFTLNLGSSANFLQSAVEVLEWKINGVLV